MSECQRIQQAHGNGRGQNESTPKNDVSPKEGRELGKNVNLQEMQVQGDINSERRRTLEYMSLIIQNFFQNCLKPNYSYPEDRRLPSKDVDPEVNRAPGEEDNSEKGKPQLEDVNPENGQTLCDVIFGMREKLRHVTSIKTRYEAMQRERKNHVDPKIDRVPGEEVNSGRGKPQFKYVNPKDYKSPRDIISETVCDPGHIPSIITRFQAFMQNQRTVYVDPQVGRVRSEDLNSKDKTQCEDVNPKNSQAPSDNHGSNWALSYIRLFIQNTYDRYIKPKFGYPKENLATIEDVNPDLDRKRCHCVAPDDKPQCGDTNPEDCEAPADEFMESSLPSFDAFEFAP